MKRIWSKLSRSQIGLAALLGFLFVGCETMPEASKAPDSPESVGSVDRMRVGDKVTIEFTDVQVTPPIIQTIREDGSVSLPLNITMKAAGKTRAELAKEIEATYVPKYYRRLTVFVRTEDRFYFVGGEVKAPSRQLYISEMTVLKAIQSAGDFTDFADKKRVQLMRANGHREVVNCLKAIGDPKMDPPVYPGDRIVVKRRIW